MTVFDPPTFGECWIWVGARNASGYGKMMMRWQRGPRKGKLRSALAHRISYMAFKHRRLSAKSVVRHTCDTPLCCNPAHLIGYGGQKANMRDAVKRGRHKSPGCNQHTKERACL